MTRLFDVTGKVILVTGGGNGIGRGILLGLAAAGATAIAWDLSVDGLQETAAEADAAGTAIETAAIDVTQEAAVIAAIDAIVARHGRIDAVFVNAGIAGRAGPAIDMTAENWRLVHQVNLDGAFFTARAAARHMRTAGTGKIIFTASVWGERGAAPAQFAAYMSSKGAIINLTRQLALELAPHGINVNGIAPSGFMTSLGAGELDSSFGDWLTNQSAFKRLVEPAAMVGPALFLASAASDWVTGTTLPVDGGYLAG